MYSVSAAEARKSVRMMGANIHNVMSSLIVCADKVKCMSGLKPSPSWKTLCKTSSEQHDMGPTA